METNHLDSNVLLPPRKRLLAGLKKQNSGGNLSNSSTSHNTDATEARVSNLINFHMGNPNLSLEEAARASRAAATSAHELALRARAVAIEKSEIAARAMAIAKRALDLAASISEDEDNKERYLKKNRMKKHLNVQTLGNKKQRVDKSRTDEELARNLHRAINSSPRILKSAPGLRSTKIKRLKFNGNVGESGENKFVSLEKGKMKQKKLPLSVCSFRGRVNPEEDVKLGSFQSEESTVSDVVVDGVEKGQMWKCKAFKGGASVGESAKRKASAGEEVS